MTQRGKGRLVAVSAMLVLAVVGCSSLGQPAQTPVPAGSATEATFVNPVLGRGADPYLAVVDGRYYSVQSASNGKGVTLSSSTSLATLGSAPKKKVFTGGSDGAPCCEWWAPELHHIDSRWYIYVAADGGDNKDHRSYVLSSDTVDGPYRFEGRLQLPGNRWAIDATIFTVPGGKAYVVWSGWPGDHNGQQNLYLARLDTPTQTTGPAVRISAPTLDWETRSGTVGVLVNEGPSALVRDGKVYLSYSASGCWTPDYALGMLTADVGADLTKAASWRKSPEPVFAGGDESGEYGTGHNSFFTSPDGSQTWFVYHAVTTPAGSCGDERQVYAQPLTFAADGTPQFGTPSGSDTALPLPAGDPGS